MKLEVVYRDGRKEILDSVESFTVTEQENEKQKHHAAEVVQAPIEGRPFEVNPLQIDRSLFEKPRNDQRQEWTRQIIQEAFAEADKYPEEYAEPFYTLIPAKCWEGYKTVEELKQYATILGGQMADWVQQALEWAQRICNGEQWKQICNKPDTAKYHRMIMWKDGKCRVVGGMRSNCCNNPASEVDFIVYANVQMYLYVVPLVCAKKQQ